MPFKEGSSSSNEDGNKPNEEAFTTEGESTSETKQTPKSVEDSGGQPLNRIVSPEPELTKNIEKPLSKEQVELSIRRAENFEQLLEAIQKSGGIKGSQKFYTPDELIHLVKWGDIKSVTSTMGLRQKVIELNEIERLKRKLEDDPRYKLEKRMTNIKIVLSTCRFNLATEKDPTQRAKLEKKISEAEALENETKSKLDAYN
jgi:hypothetical protein